MNIVELISVCEVSVTTRANDTDLIKVFPVS